jgi:peroxiredoxin
MCDGYWPVFDSIYVALSSSIKNTLTAKVLSQRLKSSRTTAIGQMFPSLRLIDIHDQAVSVPVSYRPKYTLVDFWFSHCGPCLEQFPKLREVFNAYRQKGFDIIGISTDRKADVKTWKKTVKDKQLEWSQYVDLGGKLTTRDLAIRAFPSNFLLDEQGRILKKNLSPVELSQFLSERL